MSDLELPVRTQVEPIVAWKELKLAVKGGLPVLSGWRRDYDSTLQVAECLAGSDDDHAVPDPDCKCGFYAVAVRVALWRPALIATVELFGTVIVCEKGFRASHQRVVAVDVPAACEFCLTMGDERRASDAFYFSMGGDGKRLGAPHGEIAEGRNAAVRLELGALADRFGVPFAWVSGRV
jgi:hypothetical protein